MLVTIDKYETALLHLKNKNYLVVDTETTGLHPFNGDKICGIAISDIDNHTFYFPFRHEQGYNLPENLITPLINILEETEKTLYHNAKFDIHMLMQEGMLLPKQIEDTLLASHLLNENEESHGLKQLGSKYLAASSSNEKDFISELLIKSKFKKGEIWRLSSQDVSIYAEKDVYLTLQLMNFYRPYLEQWELINLFEDLNRFELLICKMENRGINIDIDKVNYYQNEALGNIACIRSKISELAGYEINPGSPLQLKKWLKLPDTSTQTLDELESDREDINLVKEYRAFCKMSSTYYQAFKDLVDEENNLHCNFRLTGTISGRLSCSEPNLQSIPQQSDKITPLTTIKNKVKHCLVARKGFFLVECDYSQAELRMCAHYANEQLMKKAFDQGEDLHAETALNMGLDPKKDRHIAKTLNFAVLYGAGPKKLSEMMKISESKASEYLLSYFRAFPNLKPFKKSLENIAIRRKYIRLFSNRVRHFPPNEEYKALNNLLQGSVAEMVRKTMLSIDKKINDVYMLLQIHDSIIFEVEESKLHEKINEVLDIMEDQPFNVKMVADAKYGTSLGNMAKFKDRLCVEK